jgi:hypothetical protein
VIGWIRFLLFDSMFVQFGSRHSLSQSLDRLRRRVRRWYSFETWWRECAVGAVTSTRVRIVRAHPLLRNNARPYFCGRLSAKDGRVTLEGRFALHLVTRIFLGGWLGLWLLVTLVAVIAAVAQPRTYALAPLFGTGMVTLGLVLVYAEKSRWDDDVLWLSDLIREAWRAPPNKFIIGARREARWAAGLSGAPSDSRT